MSNPVVTQAFITHMIDHWILSIHPECRWCIQERINTPYWPLSPMGEAAGSNPAQSGFESLSGYNSRQDVCDCMNASGILCFKVPRIGKKSDIESERV